MPSFLLSSFSLVAVIIVLNAAIYFFALQRLSYNSLYKRWLLYNYAALFLWHATGFISGGIYGEWREITYRYTNTIFNIGVIASCITLLQVAYLFPNSVFEKERKKVFPIFSSLGVLYILTIIWYHFVQDQTGLNSTTYGGFINLLAGIYSLVLNLFITTVHFRKYLYYKKNAIAFTSPSFILGISQLIFIFISLSFIYPGTGNPLVLPIYIYGFWILLQVQNILFIVYSAFPVPFHFKIIGFTLATVMAIFSITIMVMFTFTTNADIPENIRQRIIDQPQLWKLFYITLGSILSILFFFPFILKRNFIKPLDKLKKGIEAADSGNLNIQLDEGLNDEIGLVTRNFNKMVVSLRESQLQLSSYTENLENLVEIRTASLTKSLQELKATQDQLIHSEKLASLGELTAGIAHEIQNPLNFVNNFAEVNAELIGELKKEIEPAGIITANELIEDIKANSEKITQHGKRADSIVKGMLQHSRKSSGQKELTDINALCDEYLRLAYHGLRAKEKSFNAQFETDFDLSLPKVNVVSQDIGRVILNLINNAFYAVNERYKKEGKEGYVPQVKVSTRQVGDQIEITVTDNGGGIPPNIREKIFQPFFTTKPTGEGTGLGLSMSYDIITKGHGGKMEVVSKEGEGSSFILQIPM